ncbi:S10 family serine carboxypeptidase-like protein [Candidatus Phyllobacterium onerii]|uniref:S10 family serine carboxypeptidase-like protein n=1 Tax=Candidatus Phyllobacterium onerii TaxID=3020828 RepID=UPI002330DF9D|nr:hypothetical protein [Phyllobacterium sp. IY22]
MTQTESTFVPPQVDPPVNLPKVDPGPVIQLTDLPLVPVAPADAVLEDKNTYSGAIDASLELAMVSEAPAVKNHQMTLKNGETISYTARAGHLIAYAPHDRKAPEQKDAQASIFYMAYTREDLPKENRPVTFFWNGGPGSASIWLHLGSWAPKRLKTGIPNIPKEYFSAKPGNMPLIDNLETLLDKTDLVFVDPVGTGLSQAIAPHLNAEFWGMEVDARINRDFVTRFVNFYNRQSSPKYLYGESYGGIRVPVTANLLEAAGTSNFEPDKSGKKPIVLSGIILNSPILNYETNCGQGGDISCAGFLPSFGMTAEYFGKATRRGQSPLDEYLNGLRSFVAEQYNPAYSIWHYPGRATIKSMADNAQRNVDYFMKWYNEPGRAVAFGMVPYLIKPNIATPTANWFIANPTDRPAYIDAFGTDVVAGINRYAQIAIDKNKTGDSPAWLEYINDDTRSLDFRAGMFHLTGSEVVRIAFGAPTEIEFNTGADKFMNDLIPDSNFGIYDVRAHIPKQGGYDITFYEDEAFKAEIKTLLPDMFNYKNASEYSTLSDPIIRNWRYEREGKRLNARSSLPDLVSTLNYDPSVKMLALHGYYDLVTPFHQSELDLAGAGLAGRIPVKNFEGGHMFYYAEEARAPAREALEEFYNAPAYGSQSTAAAKPASVLN